jgi:hypothetical protein
MEVLRAVLSYYQSHDDPVFIEVNEVQTVTPVKNEVKVGPPRDMVKILKKGAISPKRVGGAFWQLGFSWT